MLPSLTSAFLVGLCVGSYIPFFPVALFGILLGLALVLTLLERTTRLDSRYGVILYASLLSGVVYWTLATPPPSLHLPQPSPRDVTPTDVAGRITAPVQHAPGRQTVLIEIERVRPDAGGTRDLDRVRLVWREPGATLLEGDRIQLRAKLHPPDGSLNPGGFDYAGYLERQGIDAVATVSGQDAVRVIESGEMSWRWAGWNDIDRWRATIREAAIRTLGQPALGMFLGIVIGERGYLQQDLQEWFMATGTIHLLSISGSHLGLVALIGFWLIKRVVLWLPTSILLTVSRTLTPSRIAILFTWPMVMLYALLAGAELATIRSLIMITLAFAALWLGYERHLHHALALAALIIVLHDPRAIFDISFQLSFLSVLVIVQSLAWMQAWEGDKAQNGRDIPKIIGTFSRDALLMSGAVTVATLPVVALYFNQIPWMGAVTNLVAIPLTGILLVPLGLLSAVWTVLAGTDRLFMGSLEEPLLRWFIQGLHWCAGLPHSEWHVAAPTLPSLALFYIGLGMVSVQAVPRRLRMCGAMAVLLLVCWWAWSPRAGIDGDRWRVTFLDVGQGDSAVVELPDGQTVLIDGGARYERFDMGRGVVAPFLWNRGIRRLDHVIGTHQQLDHVGGLIWVLRHIDVRHYWGTGVEREEQFAVDLRAALRDAHIQERMAVQGQDVLSSGPCRLTILNPISSPEARPVSHSHGGSSLNNQSIVSRLQCGAHSILFAADVEAEGLRRLTGDGRQPATVLKVPHHGARSSLDPAWIKDIHPQYAVISVGRANSYGHPVQAVLDVYAEEQVAVSRTDRDGAIWVTGRLSTSDITLTRMRDRMLQPIDLRAGVWRGEEENWHRLWLQFRDHDPLPAVSY